MLRGMAITVADILSLEKAKGALRIDAAAGDDDLQESIHAAVDYCSRMAGKPFVDRRETTMVNRPFTDDRPIRLASIYVKSIDAIRFWTPAQAYREEPAGAVLVRPSDPPVEGEDPIGRFAICDRDYTAVWPPAAGWPAVLVVDARHSPFQVTYTEGWPDAAGDQDAADYDVAGDIPGIKGIRKAVALMAGAYHDGTVEEDMQRAVTSLLQPFTDARFQV